MLQLSTLLTQYEPTMLNHRKWFHAHPELSWQEVQTADYVAAQLRKMGLEPQGGTPEYPLHNEHFVPDEDTLYYGARILIASALRFLSQD